MLSVGIDVGGTKVHVGLISFDGARASVLALRRLAVSEIGDFTETLSATVSELLAHSAAMHEGILGCGIGVPGTVTADGRRILKAPNLPGIPEDLAIRLEERLSIPVRLVQDSRAAALGEALAGSGRGREVVLTLTLGTGFGVGLTVGGRIFHGGLGAAGELGHTPVVEAGRPCGCGKCGCLEKYALGGGLDITARELLGEGRTARDLFIQERLGNSEARGEIERAAQMLGRTIVSAVNLLSPNAVLFSGGLSEEESYVSRVIRYVESHCYSAGAIPEFRMAELGSLAPLIGAALLFC